MALPPQEILGATGRGNRAVGRRQEWKPPSSLRHELHGRQSLGMRHLPAAEALHYSHSEPVLGLNPGQNLSHAASETVEIAEEEHQEDLRRAQVQ